MQPFPAHIVAANADDRSMLKVLVKFGASLAVKDLAGRSVYDVSRSEVVRVYIKEWHAERGLLLSGKPIEE